MRPILGALLVSAVFVPGLWAGNSPSWADAALHAVQFVDANEGWAVGDEGMIWHSIDGGQTWERQPCATRASLRSVHFLNPFTGWICGREEHPHQGSSTGVLLFTHDGGVKWRRVTLNALPGLNKVFFIDDKTGFIAGDGTDQYPAGLFMTTNSGRNWAPLAGPRCTTWLAAAFRDAQTGALAGAWNGLAMVRRQTVLVADADPLNGRNLHGLQLFGERGIAVGQGGLVLINENIAGSTWSYADLHLPIEVRANLDFHAVHGTGKHVWIAGRPGSVLIHSRDRGETWELVRTGQPLPLHGIFFLDEQRGWAVGDLGTVLATVDGGKTWQVQHRGGERVAALFVHARAAGLPVETMAQLGGEEGYLTASLRIVASDPATAIPTRATEGQRQAVAVRLAGGAAGELLWQFPLPQYQQRCSQKELMRCWNRLHAEQAAEDMLRQLVLSLRIWRPDVVVTAAHEATDGYPADALVAEALQEAVRRASDAHAFTEQMATLGLQPWQVSKLYAQTETQNQAHIIVDGNEIGKRLQTTLRDFASPAADILAEGMALLPAQRYYRLLASRLPDAARHQNLMDGIFLGPGGVARRTLDRIPELSPELKKAVLTRRNLQALSESAASGLIKPNQLLSQIQPSLKIMPDHLGAPTAYALGIQYVRLGQWGLAREVFLMMIDHYPAHPRTADALRWVICHNSSSEAWRRHALGQFMAYTQAAFQTEQLPFSEDKPSAMTGPAPGGKNPRQAENDGTHTPAHYEMKTPRLRNRFLVDNAIVVADHRDENRRWYKSSLDLESQLAGLGPLFVTDPAIQFSLQAARRNLGDVETAYKWFSRFANRQPPGPWRDAAQAELWLARHQGIAPKPLLNCTQIAQRPYLDGKLDDPCWQGIKPLVLRDAVGKTAAGYTTEVRLAYDQQFLYVALSCRHPASDHIPKAKTRSRDADLRPYDRVSLLLDLDRDYATYFRLEFDQRGCASEDCWGDKNWNPRWFVAVHSEETCWQIEAAIPLVALTGDAVTLGKAWACNVVRILPGRGVQSFSLPADVEPLPEGMGLLMFTSDSVRPGPTGQSHLAMPKAP